MKTDTNALSSPRLPTFHVDPPRKLQIELPAIEHDRLERYADFYNESSGASEDGPSVAAAIIQHFIARDRSFRSWDSRRLAETLDGAESSPAEAA